MTAYPRTRIMLTAVSILSVLSLSAFAHDPAAHDHDVHAATVQEAPFLAENDAAMTKMMNDMAVKPVGNVDRDFVEMMIPHHQGAIDMALAYLRYGSNEQLKRIAQEIIVDQQQEIAAMRLALGDPLPASAAVPTQIDPLTTATTTDQHSPPMSSDMSMKTMNMGN